MSRDEKLIEKLRQRPPTCDFSDVRRLLESEGWFEQRQKGSHVTFKKTGVGGSITVPLIGGRKVKGVYIDKIFEILGLEE